jgi:CheY-like chemotaxis protein
MKTVQRIALGSTFKVYLPRVDEAREEAVVSSSAPLRGTELILLVEDEDQVRVILKEILEGQGYHVLAASNGEEALSISQDLQSNIKLMITDVVMPQMSGRELAERVLAVRPNLPVLFMSSSPARQLCVRHCWTGNSISYKSPSIPLPSSAK